MVAFYTNAFMLGLCSLDEYRRKRVCLDIITGLSIVYFSSSIGSVIYNMLVFIDFLVYSFQKVKFPEQQYVVIINIITLADCCTQEKRKVSRI